MGCLKFSTCLKWGFILELCWYVSQVQCEMNVKCVCVCVNHSESTSLCLAAMQLFHLLESADLQVGCLLKLSERGVRSQST